MPPKAKPVNIYVVVSAAGVDSVHADLETAQERVVSAKSEGQTSVRTEVHSVVGPFASAPPAEEKKTAATTGSTTTAATPAKPKTETKAKDAKPKDANSEPKPKVIKPKEPKTDATPKAIKPKETNPDATPKVIKPKEANPDATPKAIKPKGAKSDSKGKAKEESKAPTQATESSSSAAAAAAAAEPASVPTSAPAPTAAPPSTSTPAKPASKTIPADEQRATNAKKGTKDEAIPTNIKNLLGSISSALAGLNVVVTGIPPTIGRKNAEKLVESHGGKLGKSITGKTTLVVLGNDAGPKKLEQISEHKIETIDEDALIKRLEASAGASGSGSGSGGSTSKKRGAEDGLPKKATKKVKE